MSKYNKLMEGVDSKGGVEDTNLEAKDTKKKRGQWHKKIEAKAKDRFSEDRPSRGQGQECLSPKPRTKDTTSTCYRRKEKKGFGQKFAIFSQNFRQWKKVMTLAHFKQIKK